MAAPVADAASSKNADRMFSEAERQLIERYFQYRTDWGDDGSSRGDIESSTAKKGNKAKKAKGKKTKAALPPGLAKRNSLPPGLSKNERLPPGIAKRSLSPDLENRLPPLDKAIARLIVDQSVVLIERVTGRILDIVERVVLGPQP